MSSSSGEFVSNSLDFPPLVLSQEAEVICLDHLDDQEAKAACLAYLREQCGDLDPSAGTPSLFPVDVTTADEPIDGSDTPSTFEGTPEWYETNDDSLDAEETADIEGGLMLIEEAFKRFEELEQEEPRYEVSIATSNRFQCLDGSQERCLPPKKRRCNRDPAIPKKQKVAKFANPDCALLARGVNQKAPTTNGQPRTRPSVIVANPYPIPVASLTEQKTVTEEGEPKKRSRFEISTDDLAAAGPSGPSTKRPRQTGKGSLDTLVQRAVEDKDTVPNSETTKLILPNDFHIISDTSYYVKKFKLTTRRLEVRSQGDVQDFIADLLDHLLSQVDSEERVAMSISSEEIPKDVCHISFRRAKFLTHDAILKAIKAMIQSGTLNEHFLDRAVRIVFHRCEGVKGRKGRRKGVQEMEMYRKTSGSIITIKNDDAICLARALVVAVARKKLEEDSDNLQLQRSYKSLWDSRNQAQKRAALELMDKAKVTEEDCSISIGKFQKALDFQINVVAYEGKTPTRIFQGDSLNLDGSRRQKIYLLHTENHFDVITRMAPLFGLGYFCDECFKGFNTKDRHRCATTCRNCYSTPACTSTSPRSCRTCLRNFVNEECFIRHTKVNSQGTNLCSMKFICKHCHKFVDLARRAKKIHNCGEFYCIVCETHVLEDHMCHIKPCKVKKLTKTLTTAYIFYDLETVQTKKHEKGLEHEPYLLVCQVTCLTCINQETVHCTDCGNRESIFIGDKCIDNFMTYVCNSFTRFKNVICVAHNGKAYDTQWVLRYMLKQKWLPEVIETGSKLMRVQYEHLVFLDSINYIPLPLNKFTSSFGLPPKTVKGFFPHFVFNVVEHTFNTQNPEESNFVSDHLPPIESYDPDGMSTQDRRKFLDWYEENKCRPFNFLQDSVNYCKMDVTILRKGCTVFRKLYLEKTRIDPFTEASTIAGTCMAIYKTHFLKQDQIGILPPGGYRQKDRQSLVAAGWLGWIEKQLGRKLESAINGKEKRINGYKVDGFDTATSTIYEFHGCYWHGHICLKDRSKAYFNDPGITADNLYEETQHKTHNLQQHGYTVIEMWECSWRQEKETNKIVRDFIDSYRLEEKFQVLDPRNAFFGGRTEAVQLYRKCLPGEKIFYQDFTSLYPWVNKNGLYPIGHPTIHLGVSCIPLERVEGLMKCKVLPPRGLYLPVLPVRIQGKLFFPLCNTCALEKTAVCHHTDTERTLTGTWVTCELKKAVEVGYIILETFEQWHYPQTTQYN